MDKQMWSIPTMACYSALKRNDFLLYATTWKSPEDVVLSEISQSPKENYCMISPAWGAYHSQAHSDRKWTSGVQGMGEGGMAASEKFQVLLSFLCRHSHLVVLESKHCISSKLSRWFSTVSELRATGPDDIQVPFWFRRSLRRGHQHGLRA